MTAELLPGERLDLSDPKPPEAIHVSDEDIVARYTSGEIRIVTDQARTQLAELPTVLASGRWELQPDFQRRSRWDAGKQSRLIESFIMNVPVPPIFLYEYEYSKHEVMDGLQRLTALDAFYGNRLRLTGLEYWKELEGRTYDELPLQLRQGIDRRYLSSIVLLYETAQNAAEAERLKELVFERINSGGERLERQESRNALSKGVLNDVLPKLARTASFCRMWGIPEPDAEEVATGRLAPEVLQNERYRQMEDVEMVLRFYAHRQRGADVPRRLGDLLDEYWRSANQNYSLGLVEEIGSIFVATSNLAENVLGERAFFIRRDRNGVRSWVPRPTLLAYDSIMAAFSKFLAHAEVLIEKSAIVRAGLERLYDENAASFDGRRTDPIDVARRDELIESFLQSVVDEQ
ncbi:DUF262 domain-containing protein [Cellulosimicrobium cellulans]|uniref:GmrSD restriction endonucleases N-terminal domain-containing protein n=1 Tax=Cellulosimicrobium cellulans TaxID=1710 RepID=A0A4Y4E0Y0_CELCE|nr:DUF262 domain-containing protein [Cellulosimicrobium cellulans]GED09495.1 hypothetical protein CCE02nite_14940 [Cellulosimicrobium cellulans]